MQSIPLGRSRRIRAAVERLERRRLLSTTYYVSPSGSDQNAGTSTSAPWATVTKVDATTFSPGDTVDFQYGGEWHGLLIASSSGTAGNPITYGAYGNTALAKPTFDGSDVVPNTAFTAVTGTTYSFPVSAVGNANANAYWVYANHTALLAATSLASVEANAGSFYVNGTTVDVNVGSIAPGGSNVFTLGDRGAGTNANSSLIDSNGYSYVTFQNIVGRETAEVGGGGSLTGGIADGYVYRVQGGSNVSLLNDEGYYGSKHIVGAIDTTGFVANGLLLEGAPEGVSGNGLGYGNATATVAYSDNDVGDTSQWINVTVENYDGAQPAFLTHGNDNAIKSILLQNFVSLGSPIALEPAAGYNITINGGEITNNTLTAYSGTNVVETIDGMTFTGAGSAAEIYGNATLENCLFAGSSQSNQAIQVNGAGNLVRFNTIAPPSYAAAIALESGSTATTTYGNLVTGTANDISVANSSVTESSDYDFFDSTAGTPSFPAGSEAHRVVGNPMFTNAAGGDYSLQSTSPAINVVPTSVVSPAVATDIRGFTRPSANIYDAGAYEFQSVLHQPTVATPAAANPNPVTGTTTALSVLGASQDGEATLLYTWSLTGSPPAAVSFSVNGTNAAKNTTATFTAAGSYNFLVTISNGTYSTTSSVAVTINQTPGSLTISPATMFVAVNTTQQYVAAVVDQFGNAIATAAVTYAVTSGGGTITAGGLFTAPATTGTSVITATSGTRSTTATATITPPNQAPTVATAASASPNPVTGTTTTLTVLGADDNGEANLTYTWATVGTPPAPVTFSVNGTNAAKTTVATFTANGTYTFRVVITDSGGLSTTSSTAVTVNAFVPVVVDGTLDGRYGSPTSVQTATTNVGSNGTNGVLGTGTKTAYTQLLAAYGIIDESAGTFDLFLAGSLSLNNQHLNLLIDSVPNAGAANLDALQTVGPYNNGSGFAYSVLDTAFRPDYIITAAFGAGTSINSYNFDSGTAGSDNVSDPSTTTINTAGSTVPAFTERVNNAAVTAAVAPANAASVTTGAEYAFTLSGLGYTAADYSAGLGISVMAIVTYGSFTQFSNQVLAPLNVTAAETAANGGSYFSNSTASPTDFSNASYFPGNQFFTVAPPAPAYTGPALYLKLDADGLHTDVYTNTTGTGTPAAQLLLSALNGAGSNVSFTGTAALSTVTVDFSAGDPLPTAGLAVSAPAGADALTVVGTPGSDTVTANGTAVTLATTTYTAAPITGGDTAGLAFNGDGGADTINVTGGTVPLAGNPTVGSGTVTLNDSAAVVFTAAAAGTGVNARTLAALNLLAGGTASVATAAAAVDRAVLSLGTLSVAAGDTLDLGGNDMVVANGSLSTITALAATGYAGGTWAGVGLASSAAHADAAHLTALGVISNANGTSTVYTTFDGVSVAASAVLVKYTLYGDANLDGVVDLSDYTRTDAGFIARSTGWANGDFNYDGTIDGSDYTLIDNAFNAQPTTATPAVVTATPAAAVVTAAKVVAPAAVRQDVVVPPPPVVPAPAPAADDWRKIKSIRAGLDALQ